MNKLRTLIRIFFLVVYLPTALGNLWIQIHDNFTKVFNLQADINALVLPFPLLSRGIPLFISLLFAIFYSLLLLWAFNKLNIRRINSQEYLSVTWLVIKVFFTFVGCLLLVWFVGVIIVGYGGQLVQAILSSIGILKNPVVYFLFGAFYLLSVLFFVVGGVWLSILPCHELVSDYKLSSLDRTKQSS